MGKKTLIIGALTIALIYVVLTPGLVGLGLERWAHARLAELQPEPDYALHRGWRRSRLEARLSDGSTLVAHARHAPLSPPGLAAFNGVLMLTGQPEPVALSGRLNWRGRLSLSAESQALAWSGEGVSGSASDVAAHFAPGATRELRLSAAALTQTRGYDTVNLDNPALRVRWQIMDDRARIAATLAAVRPGQPESRLELELDNILTEPASTITATLSALARDTDGRINPQWASLSLATAWSELQLGGLELTTLTLGLDDSFHLSGRWRFNGPSEDSGIEGSGPRRTLTDWAIPITMLATGQNAALAARTVEQMLADLAAGGILHVDGDDVTVEVTSH